MASARRAVRLLGTFCDLASVADAILSSLEIPFPKPRPPRRRTSRRRSATEALTISQADEADHPDPAAHALWQQQQQQIVRTVAGGDYLCDGGVDDDSGMYRRRCLEWLRPRLPMAWVLNQALLGRVPEAATKGHGGGIGGGDSAPETFLGRELTIDLVRR